MPGALSIRTETSADFATIHEVVAQAFERETEARLVEALRTCREFNPALSLIAVNDGRVVGHILFMPVKIVRNDIPIADALALAPLSVRPSHQNQGIGSQLSRAGLEACREQGGQAVIVVGHPTYYPRFGFRDARPFGLEIPFHASDGAFMVCELVPGAASPLRGLVHYPEPFYREDF